jgi:hypothetical protein
LWFTDQKRKKFADFMAPTLWPSPEFIDDSREPKITRNFSCKMDLAASEEISREILQNAFPREGL